MSAHPADLPPDRLLADCTQRFTRKSGPGGQNRNKVETAVVLTHRPTGLEAQAGERRSQEENRRMALARLRLLLALRVRTDRAGQGGPSPLWASRCKGGRIALNPEHVDFPSMLAEALDTLAASGWELRLAAEALGCSASQLLKLLQNEPRAAELLNAERATRGLGPLK